MSSVKLTADSSGGTVELKAPATTTSNGAKTLTISPDGLIGVTMANQWRVTSNWDLTTGNGDTTISSNWETVDSNSPGTLGSNLTESSGVFTFPSTGIYLIDAKITCFSQWPDAASTDIWGIFCRLKTTPDNSTYTTAAIGFTSISSPASQYSELDVSYIFDVTNTSTHKFKLSLETEGSTTTFQGHTDRNRTSFYVLKIGDT